MLANRNFLVTMGHKISGKMNLYNGLPQGPVLAPLFFSLCFAELRKFVEKIWKVGGWAISARDKSIDTIKDALKNKSFRISLTDKYFRK